MVIVYVESNFVLELALSQAGVEACEALLQFAESGKVRLVVPSFSLIEPFLTIEGRARAREELNDKLQDEIRQLGRSTGFADIGAKSADLSASLVSSGEEQRRGLESVVKRLLAVVEVASLDVAGHLEALFLQDDRSLSPPDANIFAAILLHARLNAGVAKLFVNRNSKDFLTPDIKADLAKLDCKLLTDFRDAMGYLGSVVK